MRDLEKFRKELLEYKEESVMDREVVARNLKRVFFNQSEKIDYEVIADSVIQK